MACPIPQGGHNILWVQTVSNYRANTMQHKSLGGAEMGDRLGTVLPQHVWAKSCEGLMCGKSAQCGLGNAHLVTEWHPDPANHLAPTNMGRKLGGNCAHSGARELNPNVTQCGMG